MTATFYDEDGYEISLPTRKIVCPRCNGRGTHTNPAIDGNGLTRDDVDRLGGDEFLHDYMSGVYNVRCEECQGRNVVDAVDEDQLDPATLDAWRLWQDDQAAYEAERRAEMRIGA